MPAIETIILLNYSPESVRAHNSTRIVERSLTFSVPHYGNKHGSFRAKPRETNLFSRKKRQKFQPAALEHPSCLRNVTFYFYQCDILLSFIFDLDLYLRKRDDNVALLVYNIKIITATFRKAPVFFENVLCGDVPVAFYWGVKGSGSARRPIVNKL